MLIIPGKANMASPVKSCFLRPCMYVCMCVTVNEIIVWYSYKFHMNNNYGIYDVNIRNMSISLTTVVLNSRDWWEIVWLPEKFVL